MAKKNTAIPILIMETYAAAQHREHISEIWWLLKNHPEAKQEYNEKLFGKHLTGRNEILRSLHFVDKEFYKKYIYKIPENIAMGKAIAVAYRIQQNNNL